MIAYVVTVQRQRDPLAPIEQVRRLRRGYQAAVNALAQEEAWLKAAGARVVSTIGYPDGWRFDFRTVDGVAWRLEMRQATDGAS